MTTLLYLPQDHKVLPALAEEMTSFMNPHRTDIVPKVSGTRDFLIPKNLWKDTMMTAGTRMKWNKHSFLSSETIQAFKQEEACATLLKGV